MGINMGSCISDPAMFYKTNNQRIIGIYDTYVDDTLHGRNVDFADFSKESELKPKCENPIWNNPQFTVL